MGVAGFDFVEVGEGFLEEGLQGLQMNGRCFCRQYPRQGRLPWQGGDPNEKLCAARRRCGVGGS